jgi:Predicted AAA-ATPase/PD-(D/E)XK nuclease superfamily
MSLRLPIGIQDFSELRTGNFVYIDKTELLFSLATASKTYFLSRPRRFGKSLLISTLRYLFEGRKDLFQGLAIENKWDWNEKHPVIRLSFDAISHKELGLRQALIRAVKKVADEYDIDLPFDDPSVCFQELIQRLTEKQGKAVILIDEYDRPIIDFLGLDELPQAEANRSILKSFFSVLKSADAHIRFLFLTGVSKFSRVSIFSDLNHLRDLSIESQFNDLCGYTQAEIDYNFAPLLAEMPTDTRDKMREWYNGYSWNGRDFVYNPFSVLNFFASKEYHNFWFMTGTPTFLVKRLNKDFQYALDNIEVEMLLIESFELENLHPLALLFQTGYLTIKSRTDFGTIILDYPNREVKEALIRALLADYTHEGRIIPRIGQLTRSLASNDMPKTVELLNGLFKTIPNQIFIAHREAYFHSVIYLTFILLGVYIQAEVNSSDGRLDAVVHTLERIFIFEFKLHESPKTALQQIINKDYAAAYRHLNKEIVGIGIKFSETEKGIEGWESTVV